MAGPRLIAAVTAALIAAAGCGSGEKERAATATGTSAPGPVIKLGTKNFTEQYILGELYAQALRQAGFKVALKSDIGSSEIIDQALTAGSIDMYPEYIGVLLSEIAGQRERPDTARAAYRQAARFERARGFRLLAPTPFSDSNALAVKPAFTARHDLRTVADLERVPGGVTIGAPPEFRARFEGLVGLREVYGLNGVRVSAFKIGDQYRALDRGRVDVAAVFTTDGRLAAGDYRILADPRRLFAAQNVAPVVSEMVIKRHGERLRTVIDGVSARLTTAAMRSMNAAVDQRGEKPGAVAARFLSGG